MKTFGTTKIIGVDHGYGNMKTANHCFPTGIDAYNFGITSAKAEVSGQSPQNHGSEP